jgi:hypothetical protein
MVKRCARCDLLVGAGCACSTPNTQRGRPPFGGQYRWIRFGPDALLISSRNMAHIPGACDHHTEDDVLNPRNGWGWISDPEPSLWDRLGEDSPAQATGGNLNRAAVRRCSDCAAALGGPS